MKKIVKRVLLFIAGFCIVIGLYIATGLHIARTTPGAYIILKNESNKNIKTMKLTDSRNINNQMIENIKNGQSARITFHVVGGEGGYTLEVTFDDNSTITGGGGYLGDGYEMTETIKSNKIESDFGLRKTYYIFREVRR